MSLIIFVDVMASQCVIFPKSLNITVNIDVFLFNFLKSFSNLTLCSSTALPNFCKALESQTALEGDTVIFDVLIDIEADVEWTLDDEKLEESDFIKFETKRDGTELLVLEDVTVAYTGHYGVTASTSAGSISCMAELIVHGGYDFCDILFDLYLLISNFFK